MKDIEITLDLLAFLVGHMRRWQMYYDVSQDPKALREARQLEREVDGAIVAYLESRERREAQGDPA